MAAANGGELLVSALKDAGVDRIFGLHGAHIDTIFQAVLDDAEMEIIDTRHEAAAGHAAEGFARASGKLGVALVTAGGGLTNVMTPIANANCDRTPVLFITGSGSLRDDETNTLQAGVDQIAMAKPVTKWAHRVVSTDHIPRLVAQAIRIATTAPRGPVLLDIPWDVLMNEVEQDNIAATGGLVSGLPPLPQKRDLSATLDLLQQAERPIIIVGSESRGEASVSQLTELATLTGTPVFADTEGLGQLSQLPASHYGGLLQGLYGFSKEEAAPDFVLMLGIRWGLFTVHGSGALIPHSAKVVQIDAGGGELGRLQNLELGIVASPAAAIGALSEAAAERAWPDRTQWCATATGIVRKRYEMIKSASEPGERMHPFEVADIITGNLTDKTTLVADGALTYLWLGEALSQVRTNRYLCHGYLGSMGVGFGNALGAQSADRDLGRRTILVTGDGAVGYSFAEFDTLARKGLPLIVIIMNNQSWGATLHFQKLAVGENRIVNTRLENGSYDAAATAFGAKSYLVSDAAAFSEALEEALLHDGPVCINVMTQLDPIPPEELILIGMDPFA